MGTGARGEFGECGAFGECGDGVDASRSTAAPDLAGGVRPVSARTETEAEREVVRLWLDGRRLPADDVRVELGVAGEWRLRGRLSAEDPFLRSYGVSAQLLDGRTLHGRARLVAAEDGWIELEGLGPASGTALHDG